MIGYQKMAVLTTMGCTAIGVVTFALAPINGILGAGVTVAAAVTLSNLTRLHSVKRRLGLRLCNRGCLKPVAAGVLAVGATSPAELVPPLPAGIWTVLVSVLCSWSGSWRY